MTRIRTVEEVNLLLTQAIPFIRTLPWDVIVHMPRSGTIAASLLATHMNAPLASVAEYCAGIIYERRTSAGLGSHILLVDDSFRTGSQMAKAVEAIRAARPDVQITTLAVFRAPNPNRAQKMQLDLALLDEPDDDYLYPWFLWKSKRISRYAVDFDGVLCADCTRKQDDDGRRYGRFLHRAPPKFIPTHPIGEIITARRELYRPQTMAWMRANGIKALKLTMGPWASVEERRASDVGAWKAQAFQRSGMTVFVESCPKQAKRIHELTGASVWCTDAQRAFQRGTA